MNNGNTRAALDLCIESMFNEVIRYEASLHRLIEVLEVSGPCNTSEDCGPKPPSFTLNSELNDLYSRLVNATDLLNHTIKRIEEQVGEFKLLP